MVGLPPLRECHGLQLPHKVELRGGPVAAEQQLAALLDERDGRLKVQRALGAREHDACIVGADGLKIDGTSLNCSVGWV